MSEVHSVNPVQALPSPPLPSDIFTGRTDILERMRQCFSSTTSVSATPSRRVFVLHGLGGSGKTQLALKFLELSNTEYHLYATCIASEPLSETTGALTVSNEFISSTPQPSVVSNPLFRVLVRRSAWAVLHQSIAPWRGSAHMTRLGY